MTECHIWPSTFCCRLGPRILLEPCHSLLHDVLDSLREVPQRPRHAVARDVQSYVLGTSIRDGVRVDQRPPLLLGDSFHVHLRVVHRDVRKLAVMKRQGVISW